LCATLFIELTSDDAMREWLPRLVGIESSIVIRLADGTDVRSFPEERHAAQLTRPDTTSAVHYLQFEFAPEQIEELAKGGATLLCDHPQYLEEIALSAANIEELLSDLRD
jgi:hypothetical protein